MLNIETDKHLIDLDIFMHKILLTSLRKHIFFLTHRRIFFWYFIVLHNYIATEIMSFYFSLMPKYINWKEIVIWNKQFYIHFSAVCVLESNLESKITYIGRAIATRDRLLSITWWNSISALMKLIFMKGYL